ncbi:hypothetical protein VP01_1265g4 [Puccinia sorghi]|uniref:Uncharacterized protein n=1 Tax=Puccinia sorghi TaxID=27349 RepID=A0A0L6VP26_9BASI|nr:hypothetical protein VP01_1265g4 [Puccinia sorghi]
MKRDNSSSTKNLHGHLEKVHHLTNPKLLKEPKLPIWTWPNGASQGLCSLSAFLY